LAARAGLDGLVSGIAQNALREGISVIGNPVQSSKADDNMSHPQSVALAQRTPPHPYRKVFRQDLWKTTKTFFGTVIYHTCVNRIELDDGTDSPYDPQNRQFDEHYEVETTFTFLPAFRLLRHGAKASFSFSNWKQNLQCLNTVPENSSIFKSCLGGNIGEVLSLFRTKQASPFDVTPNGLSLLHVSHPSSGF